MNDSALDIQYFDELSKRKAKWIEEILKDPSGQKLLDSGVDKYSDQAHFIYELLQNADDTNATEACFELKDNQLEFSHNGTRHFSISNPKTEIEDKSKGIIGDINSIVSYGQSGKKESNEGKIGKFGAGFKSVFQYTTVPEIYDKYFCFKIEKQYIPILIKDKDPRKDKETTLFILPFENPKKAYDDIKFKMESLKLPLLFLNNLESITCRIGSEVFKYTKRLEREDKHNDLTAQAISMYNGNKEEKIFLFSKDLGNKLQCSVGFFVDDKGYLIPKNYDAFCYFPTKEHTGLKFIVHAPFLLTESRENVKADEPHNIKMINELSKLTADSLLYIRDFGIKKGEQLINDDVYLNLFPLDEGLFTEIRDRDKLSFKPFYNSILDLVNHEKILPCSKNNDYVTVENAYWGRSPRIYETFDDEKLSILAEDPSAKWIFKKEHNYNSIEQNKEDFYNYMSNVFYDDHKIDDASIMNNINLKKLINIKNIDWLHSFYQFVNNNAKIKAASIKKEIFLDEKGCISKLFDDKGNELLFLPSVIKTLPVIHPELIKNYYTKEFLISLGIKEPSKLDQAKDGIIKKYNDSAYNDENDLEQLYLLYMKLDSYQSEELIKTIKNSNFRIQCLNYNESASSFDKPTNLYLKTKELENYFDKKRLVFIDDSFIDDNQKTYFLKEIGVSCYPKIKTRFLSIQEAYSIKRDWINHKNPVWEENYIDGCIELIDRISSQKNIQDSILLWNTLKAVIVENSNSNLSQLLTGKYYFLTSTQLKYDCDFKSLNLTNLQNKKWLFDNKGNIVSANKISIDLLNPAYETSSYQARVLIKSLEIKDAKFSTEEAKQLRMGQLASDLGITEEDLYKLAQDKKAKEEKEKSRGDQYKVLDNQSEHTKQTDSSSIETVKTKNSSKVDFEPSDNPAESIKELEKEEIEIKNKKNSIKDENQFEDEDEYIKYFENTKKKIEKKQLEIESEINQIKKEQELTSIINNSKKYSYSWIFNLLKKELILTGNQEEERKNLVARFSLVEKEPGTERTLLLKNPIGKIPASIEEISDVPMDFMFDDGKPIKVIADAFSIHSYVVKVKLKDVNQISNLKLDEIRQVNITFKQPSFLLEELIKRYEEFDYDEDYDMQTNLTSKIDFVFGPPGTGKTTYLSKDFLIPKMNSEEDAKIIVLTPTNKAADVIINRIMELMKDDHSYEDWLIRFGTTADEKIDVLPVYKDKHVDIEQYKKCVLVTTIHRFWYDFCINEIGSTLLRNILWDYIVIDEASMIPLAHILYPLYGHNPIKFVVAGDPFQIQPTIAAEEWKDENIYTITHLGQFKSNPDTVPHKYDVKLLMNQYRSIPDVGNVFSRLTYDGKLKHNRSNASQRKIKFGAVPFNTLNLIRYPVDKYESIYASKRLNYHSNYHIYSALFVYEFTKYIGELIETNENDCVSIGIISPYRAQSDIIEKLSRNLPKFKKVNLCIGTIHSFQGDECDIIICVFNTPPGALTGQGIFANNKNIINVAVSRAKDYLFVVVPDDNTKGIENLDTIHNLISIMKNNKNCIERDSHSIENVIFNNSYYLEENSFSTSHQNVNIYDLPEKKYEIRAEDLAVDIQVHMFENGSFEVFESEERKETTNNENTKEEIVEIFNSEKQEAEVKAEDNGVMTFFDDKDFDSSIYSMHFKLKKDAESIFSDINKFSFVDKKPSFEFIIEYKGEEFFKLNNLTKEEKATIKIKGKYLNSVEIDENIEYSYDKKEELFTLSISYYELRPSLIALSRINEIKNTTDKDLCDKLSLEYR